MTEPYSSRLESYLEDLKDAQPHSSAINFYADECGYGAQLTSSLPGKNPTAITCKFHDLSYYNILPRSGEDAVLEVSSKGRLERMLTCALASSLDYLRTNAELQTVLLEGGRKRHALDEIVKGLVLNALSQNPSIRCVSCSEFMPYPSLAQYLRDSQTLARFSFTTLSRRDRFDEPTLALVNSMYLDIANGLGANTSLEELVLVEKSNLVSDFVNSAVEQVASHPHLHKLVLDTSSVGDAPFSSFRTLLQSTTSRVEEIEIKGRGVEQAFWDDFEAAVTTRQAPVSTVSLVDCQFDTYSAEHFHKLVQSSKTTRPGGTSGQRPIDLTISFVNTCATNFYVPFYPPHMSSLFVIPAHSPIRVSALRFDVDMEVQVKVIAYYLPMAMYLRSFSLEVGSLQEKMDETALDPDETRGIPPDCLHVARALVPAKLLDAIRRNGSLTEFDIREDESHRFLLELDQPFFTEAMKRKVQAYLDRNRELPGLLSNLNRGPPTPTHLQLYPALFDAASVAHHMAPTRLLAGLQSIETDMIGPSCVAKRCRP